MILNVLHCHCYRNRSLFRSDQASEGQSESRGRLCLPGALLRRSWVPLFHTWYRRRRLSSSSSSSFVVVYLYTLRYPIRSGVHPSSTGDNLGQKYRTPEEAISRQNNDIAIVGRAITEAKDVKTAAEMCRDACWRAFVGGTD